MTMTRLTAIAVAFLAFLASTQAQGNFMSPELAWWSAMLVNATPPNITWSPPKDILINVNETYDGVTGLYFENDFPIDDGLFVYSELYKQDDVYRYCMLEYRGAIVGAFTMLFDSKIYSVKSHMFIDTIRLNGNLSSNRDNLSMLEIAHKRIIPAGAYLFFGEFTVFGLINVTAQTGTVIIDVPPQSPPYKFDVEKRPLILIVIIACVEVVLVMLAAFLVRQKNMA